MLPSFKLFTKHIENMEFNLVEVDQFGTRTTIKTFTNEREAWSECDKLNQQMGWDNQSWDVDRVNPEVTGDDDSTVGWEPIDETGEEAFWEACITHSERFSYD